MYPAIRDFLFHFPPEKVHSWSMGALKLACNLPPMRMVLERQFQYKHPQLVTPLFGLEFPNPVGLAAGFDKNAEYLTELATLGFGYAEIGTVTPLPQPGNPQPRLFRLPTDKALINRMGFNNHGVKVVKHRLAAYRKQYNGGLPLIVGGNIGKNKITPNETAWKDYVTCLTELHSEVDYFVVNVSSPNTPGLRVLQEKESLTIIFDALQNAQLALPKHKPILLKIAPDLTNEQLDDIIALCHQSAINGIVATNTTIGRSGLQTPTDVVSNMGNGGLSGLPVKNMNTAIVQYLRKNLPANMPIVASGGIFTGEDAAEKLQAGAQLLQVWTGFVYQGPAIAKNINQYLINHQLL